MNMRVINQVVPIYTIHIQPPARTTYSSPPKRSGCTNLDIDIPSPQQRSFRSLFTRWVGAEGRVCIDIKFPFVHYYLIKFLVHSGMY